MENLKKVFQMNTMELIGYKSSLLDDLTDKEKELLEKKFSIKEEEGKLLLTTDFKSHGISNEKQRTAFINTELLPRKKEVESLKIEMKEIENQLIIIDDILK